MYDVCWRPEVKVKHHGARTRRHQTWMPCRLAHPVLQTFYPRHLGQLNRSFVTNVRSQALCSNTRTVLRFCVAAEFGYQNSVEILCGYSVRIPQSCSDSLWLPYSDTRMMFSCRISTVACFVETYLFPGKSKHISLGLGIQQQIHLCKAGSGHHRADGHSLIGGCGWSILSPGVEHSLTGRGGGVGALLNWGWGVRVEHSLTAG